VRIIEIDYDIHKLIETERRDFDEPPNQALRRLLKLPEKPLVQPAREQSSSARLWRGEGVDLPDGTKLRMIYGRAKIVYTGVISNGNWLVGENVRHPLRRRQWCSDYWKGKEDATERLGPLGGSTSG
jgi:hypothetical protein